MIGYVMCGYEENSKGRCNNCLSGLDWMDDYVVLERIDNLVRDDEDIEPYQDEITRGYIYSPFLQREIPNN